MGSVSRRVARAIGRAKEDDGYAELKQTAIEVAIGMTCVAGLTWFYLKYGGW